MDGGLEERETKRLLKVCSRRVIDQLHADLETATANPEAAQKIIAKASEADLSREDRRAAEVMAAGQRTLDLAGEASDEEEGREGGAEDIGKLMQMLQMLMWAMCWEL